MISVKADGLAIGGRGTALGPVARESLQERVYRKLRRSLIHGIFDAGQVLRIQDLADTLQTSTMPVREALARLVSEQALEALPSRSVRVPLITIDRLNDLAHARTLVEGELVRLATDRLRGTGFAQLRALTEECEAAFSIRGPHKREATSELNHAFHFAIYTAAGSPVLRPIVESLWLQSGPYVRAAAGLYEESSAHSAVRHHWTLIEAMERGDKDKAVAALTEDITQSFNLIRNQLKTEAEGKRAADD